MGGRETENPLAGGDGSPPGTRTTPTCATAQGLVITAQTEVGRYNCYMHKTRQMNLSSYNCWLQHTVTTATPFNQLYLLILTVLALGPNICTASGTEGACEGPSEICS